jgi:tRNA(Ile)-lysidine synthase
MTGPPAQTAAVRLAVRRCLADVAGPVAAAVSGGADSLALAAGLAFERPGSYALVVDHRLQAGSDLVAARAAAQCTGLGLQARVLPAAVGVVGGPEAAARTARYAALDDALSALGLAAVLLGHTLDDQAETVLLGLARGAGARSLAGMAAVRRRLPPSACSAWRAPSSGRPACRPGSRPGRTRTTPRRPGRARVRLPRAAGAGGRARPGDRRGAGPHRRAAARGRRRRWTP